MKNGREKRRWNNSCGSEKSFVKQLLASGVDGGKDDDHYEVSFIFNFIPVQWSWLKPRRLLHIFQKWHILRCSFMILSMSIWDIMKIFGSTLVQTEYERWCRSLKNKARSWLATRTVKYLLQPLIEFNILCFVVNTTSDCHVISTILIISKSADTFKYVDYPNAVRSHHFFYTTMAEMGFGAEPQASPAWYKSISPLYCE